MIQRTAFKALLEHKGQLLLLGLTCLVESLAIVGQAWFFGTLINNFIFSENTLYDERYSIIYLGIAIIVRLLAHYIQESVANRLGSAVKATFRERALEHMFKLGVQHKERHGDVIHMLTDGLEQVDAYVARYIPQILYAIMIPLIMGIAIVDTLPIIGIILIITVPLIPFFMILIGKQADRLNKEQWERMSFLSGHFLDVLQGITTLKLFGRAKDQIKVIGRLSEEFKYSTLRVLRVAFLSALVLELVSTISTALIAVYLGLTLLDGEISFFSAFFILLLAPEFYTPFRQLGAAFHTGMAGKTSILKYEEFMNRQPSLPIGGQSQLKGKVQAIEIKDLTFTYEDSENGVQHISLVAKRNFPIMLVGESGAGKSTIAHIIGGFLTAPKGSVTIDGLDLCDIDIEWWRQQITYVSQHPHIMKGTLREVLSFGMDVSDKEILGLGLSGGERQRVALARAFLRKGQVLILDEVTAHLDVKTEAIISSAIKRLMDNKIVIIIGHRLQTMHWASTLYVLKHGHIIQQGSYAKLLSVDGYFKDLVTSGLGEFSSTIEEQLKTEKSFSLEHREEIDNSIRVDNQDAYVLGQDTIQTPEVSTSKTGIQGWKLLFTVLSPAKWSLVLALIFTFLTVFMNVGLLTVSAWLLASAALQPGLTYLSLAIVGVRFFGVSRAVCRYFERYTSHRMAFQGLYGLRVWFYAHLEPLAPAILKRFGAGDMLGRIMGDIEVLQFFYLRTLIPPAAAITLTILVAYGVSTIDNSLVAPIVLAAFILGLVLPLVVYAHNKQSLTAIGPQQGEYKSLLSDTMDSLEDVISYGNEQLVYDRIQHMMSTVDANKGIIERGMNLGNTLFLGGVQITVVIVVILAANALTGAWASVMVAVAAIGTQAWFEALQPMIAAVHHGAESKVATSRLIALADEPIPVVEPNAPKPFNANREITFTDVSFGYDAHRRIYEHLRLDIKQGQSIAIVGASGSGKTTLFNMLERLYDYSGSIHVGDVELKDISIDTWRNALGTITQDTYIFHASFEDNIRLARPDASEADLEYAIDCASLRSVVECLPDGIHTIVGSGGHGLSGGERQRVALARLFLRKPQVVLLDEPLEGLDQVTRKALHRDLMEYVQDKTCLYITHQLEGLEHMDRILFMDKGQIIEDGTYEELITLRGHFYEYCYLSMASIQ